VYRYAQKPDENNEVVAILSYENGETGTKLEGTTVSQSSMSSDDHLVELQKKVRIIFSN